MISTVSIRGQTAIPASIRRRYHITPRTKLEWIDDGHSISVVPIGTDPVRALRGKFRNGRLAQALAAFRGEERRRG